MNVPWVSLLYMTMMIRLCPLSPILRREGSGMRCLEPDGRYTNPFAFREVFGTQLLLTAVVEMGLSHHAAKTRLASLARC